MRKPIVYYYPTCNLIAMSKEILPRRWRLPFHVTHLCMATARVVKNACTRRGRCALAIIRGLADGYRGVNGKWRYHDAEVLRPRRARL